MGFSQFRKPEDFSAVSLPFLASVVFTTIFPLSARAMPTSDTVKACGDIAAALPSGVVYFPRNLISYNLATQGYWSTTLRAIDPACIVAPTCADHVSKTVTVLNNYPGVNFAVRSGGHDPNIGHASIADGVLISMTNLTGTRYDASTGLAYVKPGGEWNDVIGALQQYGVTVLGGRMGLVGVGGLLLQGGISFLSAQYGMAADNVIGWETVVANGSIVNIDATACPDLATAMRGSGSQFGIVTQFTIKTRPIGTVWGGLRVYDASQDDKIYAALHNFNLLGAQDPKAAIIHSSVLAVGATKLQFIYYFYDGPTPPTVGPFADYLKIPATTTLTYPRSYADLLKSNGEPMRLINSRQSFRTYTLPFIPTNPTIYACIRDKYANLTRAFLTNPLRVASQFSVDFQPMPSIIGAQSELAGGNAMGLRGSDPDRLILFIQGSWSSPSDDAQGNGFGLAMTTWLDTQVPIWLSQAGMDPTLVGGSNYLPLFMNDAGGDQNVTGSYRGYASFKALQQQMDPNQMFASRLGGFKY